MFQLGFWEIIAILGILIFLFGGKRIIEIARSIGRAYAEFMKAKREAEREVTELEREAKE